jgi:hypothetical protein
LTLGSPVPDEKRGIWNESASRRSCAKMILAPTRQEQAYRSDIVTIGRRGNKPTVFLILS